MGSSGCRVQFSCGEISEEREYASILGLQKGSARLRRLAPSLAPPPLQGHGGIEPEMVTLIQGHVKTRCNESPHQRDSMRRRQAVFTYEERQVILPLILTPCLHTHEERQFTL